MLSHSIRVTSIVALNKDNNHPLIAFGGMFKSGGVKEFEKITTAVPWTGQEAIYLAWYPVGFVQSDLF